MQRAARGAKLLRQCIYIERFIGIVMDIFNGFGRNFPAQWSFTRGVLARRQRLK